MNASHQLASLRWPQVAEQLDAGAVVIVPTGSTEQHGRHLPLETDTLLASAVAERAAAKAHASGTPVLIAPALPLGYSPHHMDFPGTLTLPAATFTGLVTGTVRSLWKHGFRKILVLNGHGGNANLLRAALQDLRFENGIRATGASYWDFVLDYVQSWRSSGPGGINHACEMETSLMLAISPEAVALEEAEDSSWMPRSCFLSEDLTIGAPVSINWSHAELHPSGSLGSPLQATAEHGDQLLEEITTRIAHFLNEFHGWDWAQPRSL